MLCMATKISRILVYTRGAEEHSYSVDVLVQDVSYGPNCNIYADSEFEHCSSYLSQQHSCLREIPSHSPVVPRIFLKTVVR
jgi:hypothetical protein